MSVAPMQSLSIAVDAYPTNPQTVLGFEPDSYTFFDESAVAGDVICVSFDGVTDHGKMVPGTALAAITWETKMREVWFRRQTAGAAVAVTVMAGSRA